MAWWHFLAAAVEAALLAILVLLWFDVLRERPSWSRRRAARAAGYAAISVPVGFLVVLIVPLWVALILIAVPALAVLAMALAG